MKTVKVGVVGAGRMGKRHCRVYSNLRRAQLVGVCDQLPEVGEPVAEEYGVRFYRRIDDLLAQVDAVSLATPTPHHFELGMRCLERGVHLLIEKPICGTTEQAEALTRAVAASGLMVCIGHIERFNPAYAELKNVLDGMTVMAINVRRMSPYADSNVDVDVIFDLMIHDLDLVFNMMGREPHGLSANGLCAHEGGVDYAVSHLDYRPETLVTLTASRVTEQKIRSIEVTAREAYVEADLLNKTVAVYRATIGEYENYNRRGIKYRHENIVERIHVPFFEPLFLELQHFVDSILDGTPPRVPAQEGLEALRLAKRVGDLIRDRQRAVSLFGFARTAQPT